MISEEIRDVRRLLETNMGKLFTHISQQAKINWIKMGDETSSMFFKRYKARKSQSAILRLSDAEGRVLEETEEIRGHIVGFYEDLLGSVVEVVDLSFPARRVVANVEMAGLMSMPSLEDIRKAVFSIGVNKSPGPNGFVSLFFKESWDLLRDDVTAAVLEFFRSGRLLKDFNNTFIALIPKVAGPTFVRDFRPISCCNVMLKIITKLLARRVRQVMGPLVSDCQGAFVSGRSMFHNIVVANEVIRGYGRANMPPRCTIKVDLHKAFDSISWTFLWRVLVQFGFPERFLGLIMECVTNSQVLCSCEWSA